MRDTSATGRIARAAAILALVLARATSARGADVHIGINVGVPPPPPPAIVLPAPPALTIVPGSPVYYAPALPYDFFYYGGLYYVLHDGYWFSAGSTRGPWVAVSQLPRPVLAVPARYYKVPPGHWKRHGPPGGGRGHGKHG